MQFQCHICQGVFSCKVNYASHLRTHTGDKPYPCKLCNKAFARGDNLKSHMRSHKEANNNTASTSFVWMWNIEEKLLSILWLDIAQKV